MVLLDLVALLVVQSGEASVQESVLLLEVQVEASVQVHLPITLTILITMAKNEHGIAVDKDGSVSSPPTKSKSQSMHLCC
jgi:hypothetical protein